MTLPSRPVIGVFDSGLGGLSVVREVLGLRPGTAIRYVGDRAMAPYGSRPADEIRGRAHAISEHLLDAGATTIVVACNTASAAALHDLRAHHPHVDFVGMEPAVKPASSLTRSGVIAVLATPATLAGELYASVVGRFATDVRVVDVPCEGWVELVEEDAAASERRAVVADRLRPPLAEGADVLVLGCTHYPFLVDDIRAVAGPAVDIVDPGVAVARQVLRIAPAPEAGVLEVDVTGPADGVEGRIRDLTGLAPRVRAVTLRHGVH